MGTNSLQAAAPRRRSFSLPSFRRSSAAERQEVSKNTDKMARSSVEEAARIQKAAAWQWYTRGVGETVVLTPARLPIGNSQAPASAGKSCIGASGPRSKLGGKAKVCKGKIVEPPLIESHRAASRFKAEAGLSLTMSVASADAPPAVPAPTAPSGGASTPLYDELELSSLCTHMADFVQRLQHQHTPDDEQSSPAVSDHVRSRPVSVEHQQTKAPPAVAVASSDDHQRTTLPSSPAPVVSTISFHRKPFSALQKLFRKALSGSIPKCTKNSSQIIDSAVPAVYDQPAGVLDNDVNRTPQYHHYHYIHHHHHHHHFSKNPEEQASVVLSRRRQSESGSSRPCTPSLAVEADSGAEEDEDDAEESRIAAYLARRRRRHSDSFSKYLLLPGNAGFDKDEGMKDESAKKKLPMQISRRYNSESRFLPSKIPIMLGKDIFAQPVEDEFDEGTFAGIIRNRRRHSAELHREEPSLERTGGKSKRGTYILGGASAGGRGTPASMTMGSSRRHSESSKVISQEAGAKLTPSRGRPYWTSLSTHYCVDVQERHNDVPLPAIPGLYTPLHPK